MESGLYKFYDTFTDFWMRMQVQKHSANNTEHSDMKIHALTMNDLEGPLIFCSYLLVLVWCIFIIELIVIKIKMLLK